MNPFFTVLLSTSVLLCTADKTLFTLSHEGFRFFGDPTHNDLISLPERPHLAVPITFELTRDDVDVEGNRLIEFSLFSKSHKLKVNVVTTEVISYRTECVVKGDVECDCLDSYEGPSVSVGRIMIERFIGSLGTRGSSVDLQTDRMLFVAVEPAAEFFFTKFPVKVPDTFEVVGRRYLYGSSFMLQGNKIDFLNEYTSFDEIWIETSQDDLGLLQLTTHIGHNTAVYLMSYQVGDGVVINNVMISTTGFTQDIPEDSTWEWILHDLLLQTFQISFDYTEGTIQFVVASRNSRVQFSPSE